MRRRPGQTAFVPVVARDTNGTHVEADCWDQHILPETVDSGQRAERSAAQFDGQSSADSGAADGPEPSHERIPPRHSELAQCGPDIALKLTLGKLTYGFVIIKTVRVADRVIADLRVMLDAA